MNKYMTKVQTTLPVVTPGTPRGTFISPEELESILGVKRRTSEYAFHLMRMVKRFIADSIDAGDPKLMCSHKYGLRVLTDAEAADYTVDRIMKALREIWTMAELGAIVVRDDHLDEPKRTWWRQKKLNMSMVAQSARELRSTMHMREIVARREAAASEE